MSAPVLRTALRCALAALWAVLFVAVATPASAAGTTAAPSVGTVAATAYALPSTQEAVDPAEPAEGSGAARAVEPGAEDEETGDSGSVTVDVKGGDEPDRAIVVILTLTVLSLAPALLVLVTSFTRIVIVLSLTRNALGVQAIPPNQVIVGLSLFLSLFIMGPTLSDVNEKGLQPFMKGEKTYAQAYEDGVQPLRAFMMEEVKPKELALFVKAADDARPSRPEDVSMSALVPAFVLSEIKTAFLIGFVIFIPFLVIDIVISSSLMSMGMMMLPPVLISLPFKLLLFVMVDGWALIVRALLSSYG